MHEVKEAIESSPYGQFLGIVLETIDETGARMSLPFQAGNANPGDALHGGVVASLINLGGLAVGRAALGTEAGPMHTAGLQVCYLAAAIGQPVVAEARLLRRGKELCFVDVAVATQDGKPIARGLATVRGRFGREANESTSARGDDGTAEPGEMGRWLPQTVPFIGRLRLNVENMSAGQARITMPFFEELADAAGGVHEGPILALLDTTGSMAAWAECGWGPYKASTVSIQAQLRAPAGTDDLVAYACMEHKENEIYYSAVEIAAQSDQRVVASGAVIYRIVK